MVFRLSNDYPSSYETQQVRNYVKSVNWQKRLNKEIPFLSKLFLSHDYSTICDLGCGPGMHAIHLAKAQKTFRVTGLDIDQNMITYANESAKEEKLLNLSFIRGNFLQTNSLEQLKEFFDVLYTLGNALMIIWTNNENFSVTDIFRALAYFIKPGGGLFFQILNSDAPRKGHIVSKISTNEQGENQILVKHFLAVDNKLFTTFSTMNWKKDENEIKISESRGGYLKLVSLEDLKTSMNEAGFADFEFFENYDGEPLNPTFSDSLMCFARKK